MFASKLTISKETRDKMTLNKFERGKIRWDRLQELYSSGELQKLRTRKEVAMAVGYPEEVATKMGGGWISRLVHNGVLSEVPMGLQNGKMTYDYYLTGKQPDYSAVGARKAKYLKNQKSDTQNETTPVAQDSVITATQTYAHELNFIKGDTTISVKTTDAQLIREILVDVMQRS